MSRCKLSIGIQTFSEMREGSYYYVDKTAIAQRMIDQGKYYFLAQLLAVIKGNDAHIRLVWTGNYMDIASCAFRL